MPPSIILLLLSIVIALLYSPFYSGDFHVDAASRILLLTAHPDDECMFFAPTILGLSATQHAPMLFSLCLSTGNADGLGQIRQEELSRSLDVLGVSPARRWVVDHPDLQDNFTAAWDTDIIANVVKPFIVDNKIDMVLTFDHEGISSHPNHKSLPPGVARLAKSLQEGGRETLRIYTLVTVPLYAKYTSALAPLLVKSDALLCRVLRLLISLAENDTALSRGLPISLRNISLEGRGVPVFVSGIREYFRALQAMRMHASQLVWFRWLYVSFSRYMWANEWSEVVVL